MGNRWIIKLYRISLVLSAGVLVGEGCIGAKGIRAELVDIMNDTVISGLNYVTEQVIYDLFSIPPEDDTASSSTYGL